MTQTLRSADTIPQTYDTVPQTNPGPPLILSLADQIEDLRMSLIGSRNNAAAHVESVSQDVLDADGVIMRAIDDLEAGIKYRRAQIVSRLAHLASRLEVQ